MAVEPEQATLSGRAKRTLNLFIDQWFIIGIGVVIALANSFPNVARTGGILRAEYTIKYGLVALIFFISGLSLPLPNLYKRSLDWKLHLVTHGTNFFLFPTVLFAIVSCIRAADPEFVIFNRWALVGMVVLGCLPTTVSSNVVMTGQAGGDQSAATIEVILGNTIGTFLSPALLSMFLSSPQWSFGKPVASGPGGTSEIYRQVIEQLGYTVFIPLFAGEVIQYIWPTQVKWVRLTFKLAKVGSVCLLGVIWSTFSSAFYTKAFDALSWQTVIVILFVNIAMYGVFSILMFAIARLIPIPKQYIDETTLIMSRTTEPLFDAGSTIALMFCGAAKGIVLGSPIVQILYGGLNRRDSATLSIPLVLYQGSQVVMGQLTVAILRAWKRRVDAKEEATKITQANMVGQTGQNTQIESAAVSLKAETGKGDTTVDSEEKRELQTTDKVKIH